MKIDVYTATGTKKGSADLPESVFGAAVNEGLMHQAVLRQQGNRRQSIAHAKSRGEIQGSTRKLFAQKGTGRARRGSIRAPLLRGGGKAFGPRSNANFTKNMPKKMRQAALRSCLSLQAGRGVILGLENFPSEIKTKNVAALLQKMPVETGRSIVVILPGSHLELQLSARNIPGVKTVQASYLSPEDVLSAHHLIFLVEAIEKVEEMLGQKEKEAKVTKATKETKETKETKATKDAKTTSTAK